MFIVMCCGSLPKLPCVPQLDTSRAIDCSITLVLRARRCSISSRFAATRQERLGGWDHLTWISCWIASQGHRSALWPNVVPLETGPTDLETARRLVPTLVHGLARCLVRGQAALDGRILGQAQRCLVWFSYCTMVSSWVSIRLFNGMFFHLTSEGQPHRRSRPEPFL